ncbi:hypothetical protein H8356DRAFT_1336546 [Neocallimastix lanati (nom. inval.)]|nr:hypothetical protein H8356DRAFT_1336546 [Neocallimastix sp. JGI-2020a]
MNNHEKKRNIKFENSNFEELKNIFNNSKFYDNEFIKCLLLYKNKTPIKNLNYEISKDKYKIVLDFQRRFNSSLIDTYIIENMNKNLLKFLVKHGVDINKVVYSLKFLVLFDYSSFIIGKFKLDTQLLSDDLF